MKARRQPLYVLEITAHRQEVGTINGIVGIDCRVVFDEERALSRQNSYRNLTKLLSQHYYLSRLFCRYFMNLNSLPLSLA